MRVLEPFGQRLPPSVISYSFILSADAFRGPGPVYYSYRSAEASGLDRSTRRKKGYFNVARSRDKSGLPVDSGGHHFVLPGRLPLHFSGPCDLRCRGEYGES